ncbi:MAG: oxidase [Chitinophagaceae bacterium]|nr:oxidase [Chitinophagaceae bacterium]
MVIGRSDEQHQELLLMTNKGEWKEKPTMAVGLAGYLKDDDVNAALAEIKQEFERDGMEVKYVGFNNDKIEINASY